jgi:hypothetical protein
MKPLPKRITDRVRALLDEDLSFITASECRDTLGLPIGDSFVLDAIEAGRLVATNRRGVWCIRPADLQTFLDTYGAVLR